ncbi:hypothetical protein SAMN02745229_01552 [Butyrivibrio fibrisolvens DSM 3071]|jgi:predicted PurR-regulated permease PerM|uniref:Methyl-accepting chemotaxis protein n=1 Tax=Butyrivibrio fibrisolvens DSM 3071 TaxID=1121131 RepID=A0A1M5YL00_BUTFI|nr:hypothetical protein [Butyrivibrio fibrisolvens]SHI12672.1 hypothetical protein SAMN02745229_01552 [Butyrivibrio fibrisolvens DSM 3071]
MENNAESTLSEKELLSQIRDLQEKKLKVEKRTSKLLFALTLVILIAVIVMVPATLMLFNKVTQTVDKANGAIDDITATVQRAETTLDGIDEMTESASQAASNMNQLVEDNSKTLNESIKALSEVDYEGLNEAINDLKSTASSMAEVMSVFGH